ncbi:MAG: hypothetical protein PHX02_03040 [Oscillospiraceae bacterium]|nr:hypothetical protein [Oscillospiraceae bacterium]
MKSNQIKAVHQRDLKKLLKSLKVYDEVKNHTQKCFFCKEVICEQTISAVFPYYNTVCFCCENHQCCSHLLDLSKEDDGDG